MFRFWRLLMVTFLVGVAPLSARAEAVRYRFVPVDACGTLKQVSAGPEGAIGEQLTGFGLRPQPFNRMFRPNQIVTFRHPYTGRNVTVPLTLPQGTPRLEYRSDRIVYNYGSYVVEARFFADGSVDVLYNSGFLSPLVVE
ncbi:MAG: hypothetical protein HY040_06145 [Planctomycetes bacterium]|nr:hypothetical protein [Planctomycetota bacterium]